MLVPVVIGDVDPGAVEELIALCVRYHRIRTGAPVPAHLPGTTDPAGVPASDTRDGAGATGPQDGTDGPGRADPRDGADAASSPVPAGLTGRAARQAREAAAVAEILAGLERQILAKILQVLSGPGGVASFLRRNLLGQGLNGPSLPLDVGQP